MIQPQNTKFKKYKLSVVICASVLLLLIVGYVVIEALIGAGAFNGSDTNISENKPPLDIRDGESTFNGYGVAYPHISKSSIISVAVDSHKDAFVMARPSATDADGNVIEGKYLDYFTFSYDSGYGPQVYYPDILLEEPNTDYTDFYAMESSDGLNAYKIDYLCAAIGALYFGDRIELSDDVTERAKQRNRYGLSNNDLETVYVKYLDSEGKEQTHTIYIGDELITGVGYYFMVDDRNYVYTARSSGGFEYLLGGFEQFLHSRLVAMGLPSDGIYEPYLTSDYKQWTNVYHDEDGELVTKDSEVVVTADLLTPKYTDDADMNKGDGYSRSGYKKELIDLRYVSGRPEFGRLIALVEGAAVGNYEDNEIVVTVVTNINEAKLNMAYRYNITGIESVLTDTAEYDEAGYAVGDNDLVKVKYLLSIQDGSDSDNPDKFHPVSMEEEECHAVLDLSRDTNMPEDVKAALRAAKVGDSLDLTYDVTYTEENAVKREMSYVITEIHSIRDANGNFASSITENSVVTFSYKWFVDGYEVGMDEVKTTVDLSKITEGENLTMKEAILGKGTDISEPIIAFTDIRYCQNYADFITYNIRDIVGFVEKEMVVSFEYVNPGDGRDPFYGESIYKNTLENNTYALNSLSCQAVTYLLGGVGAGSNSQQSEGLVGKETVAVGLTPEIMTKYGLYDGYTIYFELPRGVYTTSGSADKLDSFDSYSTLGFTLYISKKDPADGTRYIASTMYDIVAKIDGAQFDYLEKSFEEYWARRNLVMIDYKLIDKVNVEIATNDIYGKYSFTVDHKTVYIVDNEHLPERPEDGSGTEYEELDITVTPVGDISESELSKILEAEGRESLNLANLYDRVAGGKVSIGHDTAGAANYKEFLRLIYAIYYVGALDEAEQKEAFESAPRIFSFSFTLSDASYGYTYDFYRVSDRKVMVHIYECDSEGNRIPGTKKEASGFYVSTFAAKKMINAVVCMLNGENIDVEASYWD